MHYFCAPSTADGNAISSIRDALGCMQNKACYDNVAYLSATITARTLSMAPPDGPPSHKSLSEFDWPLTLTVKQKIYPVSRPMLRDAMVVRYECVHTTHGMVTDAEI